MEVLNNPSLEAEEWRDKHTCSKCSAKNKDISLDDIFYECNEYHYKCGFCRLRESDELFW